jgi:hypothetical protein
MSPGGATTQRSSLLGSDTQNQLKGLKPWDILKLSHTNDGKQTTLRSDVSSDKSHENPTENMDLNTSHFLRKVSFHHNTDQRTYKNSRQTADIQFVRPGEYVPKEGKTTSRYQSIEHMINVSPQLRLQMLMCREYKKYTNILLMAMFGREMLATHSLNGTGTSKPRLDIQKVNQIIGNMTSSVVTIYHNCGSEITIFHQ